MENNNSGNIKQDAIKMVEGLKGMMNGLDGLKNSLMNNLPEHEKRKVADLMKDPVIMQAAQKVKEANSMSEMFNKK